MKIPEQPDETIKAHCNSCGPWITHNVLKKVVTREDDEETGWSGGDTYQLIRCGGCDRIHLKHDSWNGHETDDQGVPETKTVYHPPAQSRREPAWLTEWDGPFFFGELEWIGDLLREIYSALHNESPALAAMGIRALLEQIMIAEVGDTGSIGGNVTEFINAGHIAPKSESIFRDNLIESGHAAMHRKYKPKKADLMTLLDITEGLIASIYVHPMRAGKMKIPGRLPPT